MQCSTLTDTDSTLRLQVNSLTTPTSWRCCGAGRRSRSRWSVADTSSTAILGSVSQSTTLVMVFHSAKMAVMRNRQYVRLHPHNLLLQSIFIFALIWTLFLQVRIQLSDTNLQGSKYLMVITADRGTINNFKAFLMLGDLPRVGLAPWLIIFILKILSIQTTM